jgi:hypothetical protein
MSRVTPRIVPSVHHAAHHAVCAESWLIAVDIDLEFNYDDQARMLRDWPETHWTSNTPPRSELREWKRVSKERSNDFGSNQKFK